MRAAKLDSMRKSLQAHLLQRFKKTQQDLIREDRVKFEKEGEVSSRENREAKYGGTALKIEISEIKAKLAEAHEQLRVYENNSNQGKESG